MLSKLPSRLLQRFAKAPKSPKLFSKESAKRFKLAPPPLLSLSLFQKREYEWQIVPIIELPKFLFPSELQFFWLPLMQYKLARRVKSSEPLTLNEKMAAKIRDNMVIPLLHYLCDLPDDEFFVSSTLRCFPGFLFLLPRKPGMASMLCYLLFCLYGTIMSFFGTLLILFCDKINLEFYLRCLNLLS